MVACSSVQVRKGGLDDAEAFADLVIIADHDGPRGYFGGLAHSVMARLYTMGRNLYGYEKTRFLVTNGRTVGVMLGYTDAMYRADKWRTYWLMTRILTWRAVRMWGISLST